MNVCPPKPLTCPATGTVRAWEDESVPVAETKTSLRFELRPFGFRTVSVTVNLPAFGKTYIGLFTLEPVPDFPNFQDHVAGDPAERSEKYTGSPARGDCGVHMKFARGISPQDGGVGVGVGGTVAGVGVGVAIGGTAVRVGVRVAVGAGGGAVGVGVGVGRTGVGVRVGVGVGGAAVGVRVGVGGTGVGVRVGVAVAAGGIGVGVRVAVGSGGVGVGVGPVPVVNTMKALNLGPVASGAVKPTPAAGVRPVIGNVTVPPVYVPERTGVP
jgi:hypothetical protein